MSGAAQQDAAATAATVRHRSVRRRCMRARSSCSHGAAVPLRQGALRVASVRKK